MNIDGDQQYFAAHAINSVKYQLQVCNRYDSQNNDIPKMPMS